MTTDFYNLLLSDCVLALILLALFWYVSRISRGLRGIALWGVAHVAYSLGASMLDGTSQELARTGNLSATYWIAGLGGLLACAGLAALAWSIVLFVQQRALTGAERLLMPLCLAFSLAAWLGWGTVDAQGAAMSAAEVLRFFMAGHGLRQSDLPEIGNQSKVSEILSGKRAINLRQAKALSERFAVPLETFVD